MAVIETYLQDHHAGSAAGVDVFDRVAKDHGDAHVRQVVGDVAEQIREDQTRLEAIMSRVGAKPSALKDVTGKVGEKLGRLKPNEHVTSRSPLSDYEELEMLAMAVHGKGLLWKGLIALADPRLDEAELRQLADRADEQEITLLELRLTQVAKLLAD